MKISKITRQKKNKSRYNIFTETDGVEEFTFSVHEDLLIRFHLRKDMQLTEGEIKQFKEQDAIYRYYAMAINYLSYRMRSKEEVARYLKEKEASDDDIKIVMEKLENERLLDDLEFSNAFVRTKVNTSSNGPLKVKQELLQKGVAAPIAEQALESYTAEEEIDKATKLVQKKLQSNRRKSFKEQAMQLKQSLMQKGFTQEAIEIAFQQVEVDDDEELENEALRYQGEKAWAKYSRKHEGYMLIQKVKGALYQKGFSIDLINQFIDEKNDEEMLD
ncbi:recombination regulator RecX [Bacillaceae bacterium W0354]